MWKTDVVDSWIADKETQVRSEDYGRDLSSVQTFLTKQVGQSVNTGTLVSVLLPSFYGNIFFIKKDK